MTSLKTFEIHANGPVAPRFVGYTVGLRCNNGPLRGVPARIEYTCESAGTVTLQAVSGWSGWPMFGSVTISTDDFNDRPHDPYDSVTEARWALNLCGWSISGDDC